MTVGGSIEWRRRWRVASLVACGLAVEAVVAMGLAWADQAAVQGSGASGEQTAALWAKAAWRLLERGDARAAGQAFAAAGQVTGERAELLVGAALASDRLGDEEGGLRRLNRALELDNESAAAHRVAGFWAERRGDVREALGHYQAAIRLDPNDADVRDRLASVRPAVRFEETLDRLYAPHFVVQFRGDRDRATARVAADRLEVAYTRVGELLLAFPDGAVPVLLYPGDDLAGATDSPRWVRGLFDGRIHVAADAVRDAGARDALLVHEYTHAVVHRLSHGRAPTWLQEGLALYCERRLAGTGRSDRSDRHRGGMVSPASTASLADRPSEEVSRAYRESESMVDALAARYGRERIHRLLRALSSADRFDTAFEASMGEPFHVFEARVLAERRRPAGPRVESAASRGK